MRQPLDEPRYGDRRYMPPTNPHPPPQPYQPQDPPAAGLPPAPWHHLGQSPGPDPSFPPPQGSPHSPPPADTERSAAPPSGRRGRGGLLRWLALLAAMMLGLGGLGAWLLLRDTDRDGAEDPVVATQEFLQAVYGDHDSATAASRVCSEARDEAAISTKIDEIRTYQQSYLDPRYTWSSPEVLDETGGLAIVGVTVTMTTGDEKTASLNLSLAVLDKDPHGWWVCNLETVPGQTETPSADNADQADEDPEDGTPNDEDPGDEDLNDEDLNDETEPEE